MRLTGIVTKPPTNRDVRLKSPRPNEPATKTIAELSILDDDGGQVIVVQSWKPLPADLAAAVRGDKADLRITNVTTFGGALRAELAAAAETE